MTLNSIPFLSPTSAWKSIRRWWIKREIEHIRYHLAHIEVQRDNDVLVERVLRCREMSLFSQLTDL